MTLVALALSYAGWVALCLALPRHQRHLLQREVGIGRQRLLRGSGAVLLALAFAAAVAGEGWQLGPVAWCACLAVAGLGLVLAMPHAPRACLRLAVAAPLLALPMTLLMA
ncbi:DUF3325 domain-containing protein [Solimonas sp. K1W22B-7]|uniref:DUF3325 domain-containing protein n=1 Tax=Solimonas sp. K1W22B-7 TaxID=2303331 RepID=UPI000E336F54|nr:DUF3325 domain-containing protein [Solimonas sp. K1W22B-7]AXQ29356.1 DUF3325 domain-containing protein [Solimonas sp. K1W22B-7]